MGLFGLGKKSTIPSSKEALPGRSQPLPVPEKHHVNGNPLKPPFPENMETAVFGLGCFGEQKENFGSLMEYILQQRAMLRVTLPTLPTKKFVLA